MGHYPPSTTFIFAFLFISTISIIGNLYSAEQVCSGASFLNTCVVPVRGCTTVLIKDHCDTFFGNHTLGFLLTDVCSPFSDCFVLSVLFYNITRSWYWLLLNCDLLISSLHVSTGGVGAGVLSALPLGATGISTSFKRASCLWNSH